MSGKNVNFGDKKIKKVTFTKTKKQPRQMTLILIKYQSLKKNHRQLFIKLPQMTGYVRKFEGNAITSFKISDKQVLKKYNEIWKKLIKHKI